MPDIQQRITEILLKHFFVASWSGEGCGCNSWRGDLKAWYSHLAEVLVSELGLTDETAFQFTHNASGRSSILTDPGDVRVARKITESHNLVPVTRYVTEWVADE